MHLAGVTAGAETRVVLPTNKITRAGSCSRGRDAVACATLVSSASFSFFGLIIVMQNHDEPCLLLSIPDRPSFMMNVPNICWTLCSGC